MYGISTGSRGNHDIATAKPSLQSPLVPVRVQVLSNQWKSSPFLKRSNFHLGYQESHCGKLQVRAVATFEPKCLIPKQDGLNNKLQLFGDSIPSSTQPEPLEIGDSDDELDEREKLRRDGFFGLGSLPRISSLLKTNHQSQNQRVSLPLPQTSNVTSKSCLAFGSSIRVPAFSASQWINRKQTTVFTSHAQLNEVAELTSNSVAAINTKPKVSSPKEDGKKLAETAISDVVAISALMEQVLGLVKLVDSRDIIELQLKQSDCYLDDEEANDTEDFLQARAQMEKERGNLLKALGT
ncbi:uncharacterized protein LOC120141805 [Hibiscus syriacus]|uniref:uncharacterized protein LOC120141805 n=1 Tax=Hibiscus syriacus TaxID=106335 RepID=UPI001923CBE2|nr:uncharacterized protein LOC120141805 [Hibiscus syriacus]